MGKSDDYQYIKVINDRQIVYLVIQRPEAHNALNNQVIDELLRALCHVPPDTCGVILRGAGAAAFSAGADLREMQARTRNTELTMGSRHALAHQLETAPFPTIAAVNGHAYGGGWELALACHLRIAADNAQMGLTELRLGLIPGNGGTQRLRRLAGRGRALQWILFSERLTARQAYDAGLVNWVVPHEDFDNEVERLAQRLRGLPALAVRGVLESVIAGETMGDGGLIVEHQWFLQVIDSPDKEEGVTAFLEKRPPRFGQGGGR